jgi:autotransporter-associated beta strand protein
LEPRALLSAANPVVAVVPLGNVYSGGVWSWSGAPGAIRPGDTVHAAVRINDHPENVYAFDLTIAYNTALLDLTNGTAGTDIARSTYLAGLGWAWTKNVNDAAGKAYISLYATNALAATPAPADLLSIDFRVPATAASGTSTLGVSGYIGRFVNGDPGWPESVDLTPLSGSVTLSGTRTWVGNGGDNYWSTGANWSGGVVPGTGDDLVFSGNNRKTPENTTTGRTYHGISLDNGFTISGVGVTLNAGGGTAIQNVASTNTVALPVTLASSGTVLVSSGRLNLDGLITNGGNQLTVDAAASTTARVGGKLTGAGKLLKRGGGSLELAASDNDYSGGTEVAAGTLVLRTIGSLPARGSLTIGAGASVVLGSGLNGTAATASLVAAAGQTAEVSDESAACAAGFSGSRSRLPGGADSVDAAYGAPGAARQAGPTGPLPMPVAVVEGLPSATAPGDARRGETAKPEANRRDGNGVSASPRAKCPTRAVPLAPAHVDQLASLWGLDPFGMPALRAGRNHALLVDVAEVVAGQWA